MKERARKGSDITRTPLRLLSAEGLELRGVIERPAKARAFAILLHGFKGFANWGFLPWLSEQLNQAGVATCRFDFSRNGVGSDGENFDRLDLFADDTYSTELSDLQIITDYIVSQRYLDHLPLSLLGFSRGGGIALLAAAQTPRLRSVVTWSAVANLDRWDAATVAQWRRDGHIEVQNSRTGQMMPMSTALLDDYEAHRERFDVLRAASELKVPYLVVHGRNDETVPVEDAHRLAAATPQSSILLLEKASHTLGAMHPLVHVAPELLLAGRVTARFLAGY